MDALPHDIIREIGSKMDSTKNKASLESVSRSTRNALRGNHETTLPKGPKSYLTSTRGRYQRLYDNFEKEYEAEKSDFSRRLDLSSYHKIEILRMVYSIDLVNRAKEEYEQGRLFRLVKKTWKHCPRDSVSYDLYRRIRHRLEAWSQSGPYKKKYIDVLAILRRIIRQASSTEEHDLGAYLMDAILKESLLFFNSDIHDSK